MIEYYIVLILILVSVFLTCYNFLVGALSTPKGFIYLGTVHWPGDYFYYLTQFVQGASGNWFQGYNLFTSELFRKTFVGWPNIFLGRIFALVGIGPIVSYQISLAIFTLLFLFFSYLFIREVFPKKTRVHKWLRVGSFFLFATTNAFPSLIYNNNKLSFWYHHYWFNNGNFFIRNIAVPHQMIGRALVVLTLLLVIWWWKRKKKVIWKIILGLIVSGFVLASVDPVRWIFMTIVLGVSAGFINTYYFLKKRKFNFRLFFPSILFFLSGFPIAFYLKNLFSTLPYNQLRQWEAARQLRIPFSQFVLANGPVFILAIIGIFVFIRKFSPSKVIAVVCTFLSLGIFFSYLPDKLSLMNVRFLPAVLNLFFAIYATSLIVTVLGKFKKHAKYIFSIILASLFLIVLPSFYAQIKERSYIEKANTFFYLPEKAYSAMIKAKEVSDINDVFIVKRSFDWSFPAVAGRRIYQAHPLMTIDYEKKVATQLDFFAGKMTEEQIKEFLLSEKITYIMDYYTWLSTQLEDLSFLEKVYDNGYFVIYKVVVEK